MTSDRELGKTFGGRVVILTGAASGIGLELARLLVRAGAKVHGFDIRWEEGSAGRIRGEASGSFTAHVLDVSDREQVEESFRAVHEGEGGIDYLFNNAGVTLLGETHKLPFERCLQLLDVNLMGVVNGIHAVYPWMVARGSGHIVNTASVAGVTGYATSVAYAASKSAVLELTRSLRLEAAAYGVRVTAVCPGYVNSGIFSQERIFGAERSQVVGSLPAAMLPPDAAARMMLEGIRKRRHIVVFPLSAKIFYMLGKWMPCVLGRAQRSLIVPYGKKP